MWSWLRCRSRKAVEAPSQEETRSAAVVATSSVPPLVQPPVIPAPASAAPVVLEPRIKRKPAPSIVARLGPVKSEEARRWLQCRTARDSAKYRMLCLHWAGGNSGIYRTWDIPNVEVVAVELPGRNVRMREAPLTNFEQITDRIVQSLQVMGYIKTTTTAGTDKTKPLIIFGHSFGAMLTIHLARTLVEKGAQLHYVIVSGCSPLDVREHTPGVSGMPSAELIDYLVKMGGVPAEVAANRELMDIFIPAIRGDYTVIDNYTYTPGPPLPCPILAFGGEDDERAPSSTMSGWLRFTSSGQFDLHIFKGGHFFIKQEAQAMLNMIREKAVDSQGMGQSLLFAPPPPP